MDTGTARPPTCARERPSTVTVRDSSRLPSASTSAPASDDRSCTAAALSAVSRMRPSTVARPGSARTRAASARPPNSSPRPVTTMVLPAPVSPVMTFIPRVSGSVVSSMTPSPVMRNSSSTAQDSRRRVRHSASQPLHSAAGNQLGKSDSAKPTDQPPPLVRLRQPSTGSANLATSRSVNGRGRSRTTRTGSAPRRTVARAPGATSNTPAAVAAHHRPGAVRVDGDRDGRSRRRHAARG